MNKFFKKETSDENILTEPKISIIIPVYNVEKYLPYCIESCINQTLDDIEIIIINDGSTDNSLKICKEYALQDSRIKIISQNNKGVSTARNAGLKKAKGEYIQFVDADDWLELNSCEFSYKKAKEKDADILFYAYNATEPGNKLKKVNFFENFGDFVNSENDLNKLIPFLYTIWDKIYKRSFIKETDTKFPDCLKTAEDGIFNLNLLFNNPKMEYLKKCLYNYRTFREGSATSVIKIDSEIKAFKYLIAGNSFKNAEEKYKLVAFNKAILGVLHWYSYLEYKNFKRSNYNKTQKLLKYINKNVDIRILEKSDAYKQFAIKFKSPQKNFKNIISFTNEYSKNKKRKVITFFGIKLKIKCRKLFNYYSSNEFFKKQKLQLLDKTIYETLKRNGYSKKYLFGHSINNIEKKILEPYLKDILLHDYVFIIDSNNGEAFLTLQLINCVIKKENAKKPLLIFTLNSHIEISKMFDLDIPYMLIPELRYSVMQDFFRINDTEFYLLYSHNYYQKIENNGNMHFYQSMLNHLNLSDTSVHDLLVPKIHPYAKESFTEKINDINLNLENFVIISPEANSCKNINNKYWEKLIEYYRLKGMDVFVNTMNKNEYPNTKACKLTFEEFCCLIQHAHTAIFLRSGLCDIAASFIRQKIYVLYSNLVYRDSTNTLACFSLKKLPIPQKNLIEEINVNNLTENEIFEEKLRTGSIP